MIKTKKPFVCPAKPQHRNWETVACECLEDLLKPKSSRCADVRLLKSASTAAAIDKLVNKHQLFQHENLPQRFNFSGIAQIKYASTDYDKAVWVDKLSRYLAGNHLKVYIWKQREGMSFTEIAARLKSNASAVATLFKQAQEILTRKSEGKYGK